MKIITHKYIFLSISGLLVLASFAALGVWGLKLGVDFTGGSLLEIEYKDEQPTVHEIKTILEPVGLGNVLVQPSGELGVILRFKHIDEPTHQQILVALGVNVGEVETAVEKRFDTIGPTIGAELMRNSAFALILAVFLIIIYIALVFRHVSEPVSSWKYGVVAIIALIHDISIPIGLFAVLGNFKGVEVDTLFITALLTILGFSVHDTIVVFDRIRENLRKLKVGTPYENTVGVSVGETITRSINTSLTVLLVLGAIFFFGGETTKYFSLTLIVGIIAGTYSSIFVASPLLIIWNNFSKPR